MAKLRHIAIAVPDPEKAAAFYMRAFGMAAMKAVEAAGAKHWMGEPSDGTGFYEVKYHDPDGVAFDITANGWTGASKD